MADIVISKRNEVYLQIDCEPYIKQELSEYFTFEVPDAKFMPQFKNRMWNDGSNSDVHCKVSGIVTVNGSSDYISIAAWQNSGGNITVNPGNGSYFLGYFLRPL